MVGQWHTLEIPNLKLHKVYEDETCIVYIQEVQDKLVVHTEVLKTTDRKVLNHYRDVIESVFEGLRARGIKEVEAWVCTDAEIRFAQFYGFDQFLGQILIEGRETIPEVYALKKEL